MAKRLAIIGGGLAVLLALVVVYLATRLGSEGEIARAQVEAQFLRTQRDSILRVVTLNDSLQRELVLTRATMEAEAGRLKQVVDSLETERANTQLTVRRLRRKADLQERLRQTFPEMASSDWGVTEVYNETEDLGIEYLLVPLWFSETFIIDHENALSYRMQRDTLTSLNALRERIDLLQDSVLRLERDSRQAYQTGYETAFSRYEALNRDYINLLSRPRFSLGLPGGLATAAGALGAGFLIGVVAR